MASPARDFALVCSDRFEVREQQVGPTLLRVVSLPEHKANAEKVLVYAAEVLPLYEPLVRPLLRRRISKLLHPSSVGTATNARAWSCSTTA